MSDSWTYEDAFGDSHVVPRSPRHMAELPEHERVRYIAQADALGKEVERLRAEVERLRGLFRRQWVCQVVRSGLHNGAGCFAGDAHGGYRCGYRREASLSDNAWDQT